MSHYDKPALPCGIIEALPALPLTLPVGITLPQIPLPLALIKGVTLAVALTQLPHSSASTPVLLAVICASIELTLIVALATELFVAVMKVAVSVEVAMAQANL